MKSFSLLLIVVVGLTACSSPAKQHDKEIQHKANKMQNVSSGPLAKPADSTSAAAGTSSGSK